MLSSDRGQQVYLNTDLELENHKKNVFFLCFQLKNVKIKSI